MTQQEIQSAGGQGYQQPSGQTMPGGMGGAQTMNNTLPDAYWTGLTSVAQAVAVCEFCADQCVREADPMMTECIRLCNDVGDIGTSLLSLVPHESRNAQPVLTAFQQAIQACARECGQHEHAHCQECAQVLSETLDAIAQLQGTEQHFQQGATAQPTQGGQAQPSGQMQPTQGGQAQPSGQMQPTQGSQARPSQF